MSMKTTHLVTLVFVATALGSIAACGSKSSGGGTPGGALAPIDPNRPGDLLYAQALSHFGAGVTAQSAGLANRKAGNLAAAQTEFLAARTEFTTARGLFDQLRNDSALCGATPTSIRCDASGFYAGRSSYELGVGLNEVAAVTGTASTSAASFQDAVTRLDAMQAAFPASEVLDRAAYFDGRARFHLAQAKPSALDTYPNALAQFQKVLAVGPAGIYADRAQYWIGRCWYEQGFAVIAVPPRPLPGTPADLDARAKFATAQAELQKVLALYPTSTRVVNARYYLGKTWFERPWDGTVNNTERLGNLATAIGWFDQVVAAGGELVAGSHYWRGRCHYARAFEIAVAPNPPDATELGLALPELKAVPAPDSHADNALYHVVKCYVHLPVATATDPTGAYCNAASPDPAPASACAAYASLKALLSAANPLSPLYAGSPYLARAQSYITTTLPGTAPLTACVCSPW